MVMTIPDDLAQQLQAIAEQEQRSPEDVLRSLLAQHQPKPPAAPDDYYSLERVMQRMYERARRYWRQTGNTERLALTDADLDEQFWVFDAEGIPRLKSEQGTVEIPENSMMRLAQLAEQANIQFNNPLNGQDADDILNTEFADYLLLYQRNETPNRLLSPPEIGGLRPC